MSDTKVENTEVKRKGLAEWSDYIFNKVIPKKLLIMVFATLFVFKQLLDGDIWAYLAMVYMGTNGLQHIGTSIADFMKARS